VSREIAEEVGLSVSQIQANHSEYYAPSNTLMLNYVCVASQESVAVTDEVDAAKWFPLAEARQAIKANSLAKRFLESFLDKHELGVEQVKGGIK
jgi:NAD+ diphosphatase